MNGTVVHATDLEATLGRLLTVGTYVAVGLVAVGVIAMIAGGRSPLAADAAPLDVRSLPMLIATGRPEGFLWLGLLAAIATPLGRVVGALVGFVARRETGFAAVAVAILAVIAGAVALALIGG